MVALLAILWSHTSAFADPPGNNGHIQIHDDSTAVNADNNDPKVGCFYIDAFQFDSSQQLTWSVWTGTPGDPGTMQVSGSATFTANGNNGQDISGPISLPIGKYVAFENDSAGVKTKVFEVSAVCGEGVGSPMVGFPM